MGRIILACFSLHQNPCSAHLSNLWLLCYTANCLTTTQMRKILHPTSESLKNFLPTLTLIWSTLALRQLNFPRAGQQVFFLTWGSFKISGLTSPSDISSINKTTRTPLGLLSQIREDQVSNSSSVQIPLMLEWILRFKANALWIFTTLKKNTQFLLLEKI